MASVRVLIIFLTLQLDLEIKLKKYKTSVMIARTPQTKSVAKHAKMKGLARGSVDTLLSVFYPRKFVTDEWTARTVLMRPIAKLSAATSSK